MSQLQAEAPLPPHRGRYCKWHPTHCSAQRSLHVSPATPHLPSANHHVPSIFLFAASILLYKYFLGILAMVSSPPPCPLSSIQPSPADHCLAQKPKKLPCTHSLAMHGTTCLAGPGFTCSQPIPNTPAHSLCFGDTAVLLCNPKTLAGAQPPSPLSPSSGGLFPSPFMG